MADSGHFDGSTFQGIDEDATIDEAAFTSVLEGKITNNSHWLHVNGAGTAVKRFIGGSTAVKIEVNYTKKTSAVWATIHQQPLMVTKGLSKVRLLLQLTCANYDLDLKVQIGSETQYIPDFIVSSTVSSENQFKVIEFEVATVYQADTIVPLIIYGRAFAKPLPSPPPKTQTLVVDSYGAGTDFSPGYMTSATEYCLLLFHDNGNDFDSPPAPEPIYADPIAKVLPFGIYDRVIVSGADTGSYDYFELEIAYVTVRSLAVRMEYK